MIKDYYKTTCPCCGQPLELFINSQGDIALRFYDIEDQAEVVEILKKNISITPDDLKKRIESHLIDYNLLVQDDFNDYFIDRAKKLLALIEKAMGKPVADKDTDTTKAQFGTSLL